MALIKSLPVLPILLALSFTFTQAARIDITNRQLNHSETWSLDVAAGTANTIIWGRTNCNFDGSGRGHCSTGDCEGAPHCQFFGAPPYTGAEISLNQTDNLDFYDILVMADFNIPMDFSAASNGCPSLRCPADKCPDAVLSPTDLTKAKSCPSGTNYRIVFCP